MPKKPSDAKGLQALLLTAKDEVTKPAAEVTEQLYRAILSLPELKLSDGTTAQVEAYYPPEADEEGRQHCGIDVRLANGNLLEFTIRNTGWEKAIAIGTLKNQSHQR